MESYQHNQVKLAVAQAVQGYAARRRLGLYFLDGMLLRLPKAERMYVPDGFFVSFRQLQTHCHFQRNARNGVTGIQGTPSIVVEIASPSRLLADYDDKLKEYQRNGVREFWLFQPSGATYLFDLFRLDRTRRYYRQRPHGEGGWSPALGCRCRLKTLATPVSGLPQYVLSLDPAASCRERPLCRSAKRPR